MMKQKNKFPNKIKRITNKTNINKKNKDEI